MLHRKWTGCLLLCIILLLAMVVPACAVYTISLTMTPDTFGAGGSTAAVTAHVTINGTPISGHTISFSASGAPSPGTFNPTSVNTDPNGNSITTYTSGENGGTLTVTGTDTSQAGQPSASVTAISIHVLSETWSPIPANRLRTKLGIQEKVCCYTEGGITVNWSVSGGGYLDLPFTSNEVTYTASKGSSQATVSATKNGASGSRTFNIVVPNGITVQFQPGANRGIAPAPPAIYIGGNAWFIATLQPTDVSFGFAAGPQLRENIPDSSFTWPDGTYANYPARYLYFTPSYDNTLTDEIGDGLWPISCLWSDGYYQSFIHSVNVSVQYQDDYSIWTNFPPSQTHTRSYRSGDQACKITDAATNTAYSPWFGPWQ
jgi:hypothetical protein